jgi:hypothetical protein
MHRRLYDDPVYRLKAVDRHLPGLEIRRDLIGDLYVPDLRLLPSLNSKVSPVAVSFVVTMKSIWSISGIPV